MTSKHWHEKLERMGETNRLSKSEKMGKIVRLGMSVSLEKLVTLVTLNDHVRLVKQLRMLQLSIFLKD